MRQQADMQFTTTATCVVNIWNRLPDAVVYVEIDSVDLFKFRFDNF